MEAIAVFMRFTSTMILPPFAVMGALFASGGASPYSSGFRLQGDRFAQLTLTRQASRELSLPEHAVSWQESPTLAPKQSLVNMEPISYC